MSDTEKETPESEETAVDETTQAEKPAETEDEDDE
jgi:hypothetical protein